MPITHTSNSSITPNSVNETYAAWQKHIELGVIGLKPNTRHDLYIDGILLNFTAKQDGKNIGDPLISNNEGFLRFSFLYEFPFEGSYSFDRTALPTTKQVTNEELAQRVRNSSMFIELRGNGSYVSLNFPKPVFVIPSHENRIEGHGH